jgi:mannose-1-phosphate guanylyltransferase
VSEAVELSALVQNVQSASVGDSETARSRRRCPITASIWSIVLAGGEGQRMRPFIHRWLGEERPKQYCTFVGSRSMLRHTWDRAQALSDPRHVVTVVARSHMRFLDDRAHRAPGPLLDQPHDCGTAPGVFLPATLVAARDPEATLLIQPADHFVYPERRFVEVAAAACRAARERPGKLILLGVPANAPETDFGWILPGPKGSHGRLSPVERFEEKPDRERAARFLARGGMWNTMVMAVQAGTLWRLGERCLPAMMRRFKDLRSVLAHPAGELPEVRVAEAIDRAYQRMPAGDFSRDLVQQCPESTLVLPLEGVEWCDWGRPERVAQTLERLGRRPLFAPVTSEPPPSSHADREPRLTGGGWFEALPVA